MIEPTAYCKFHSKDILLRLKQCIFSVYEVHLYIGVLSNQGFISSLSSGWLLADCEYRMYTLCTVLPKMHPFVALRSCSSRSARKVHVLGRPGTRVLRGLRPAARGEFEGPVDAPHQLRRAKEGRGERPGACSNSPVRRSRHGSLNMLA